VRLPWPFGRSASAGGPDTGHAEAPGAAALPTPASTAAAPASPDSAGPALAPATGAWATLPPIQRTTGPVPVVAPAAPFLASVPGHRPLPPIVQTLGHDVAPTAPAGLVLARPSAVPSLTSSAPMPTRPVQRRAAGAPDPEPAWSLDAGGAPEPEPEPIRHMPTVAPAATAVPAARPLTRAPDVAPVTAQRSSSAATAPAPFTSSALSAFAPAAAAASPGSPAGPAGVAPASAPDMPLRAPAAQRPASRWSESPTVSSPRPVGLGAPLPTVSREEASGAASVASTPQPQAPAAPSTAPSSPPSRPAGLGVPLAAVPPTAAPLSLVAQRRASAEAARVFSQEATPPASAGVAPAGSAGSSAQRTSSPVAARPLPVLSVSRSRSGPSGSSGAGPSSAPSIAPSTGAPSPAAGASRPLAGSRPLQPSVTAQREPTTSAAAGGPAGHGGAGALSTASSQAPVAARWSGGDDLPSTVVSLPLPGQGADDAPVALRPLDAAPPEAAPAMSSFAASGMREIVFPAPDAPSMAGGPAVQRRAAFDLAGAQPGFGTFPSTTAGSPAFAASLGRPPARPAYNSGTGAAPAMPVVARLAAAQAPAPAPSPVQRVAAAQPAPAALLAPAVSTVVQRVDGAAPAPTAATGSGAHSDTELDELARALFGRIRTHLRSEVIHEREAKGLTFDAF